MIYDLKEITIGGIAVLARPISWSSMPTGNGSDDELIVPTEYMTTCPLCSQLLKFNIVKIKCDNSVVCECMPQDQGSNIEVVEQMTIKPMIIDNNEIENILARENDTQFVDPIDNGYIDTSNYVL